MSVPSLNWHIIIFDIIAVDQHRKHSEVTSSWLVYNNYNDNKVIIKKVEI